MVAQAVCVVSKGKKRARSGAVFRMQALAVKEEMRGRGLAAEALRRLHAELEGLVGGEYGMVADMAVCMAKRGVGFYGRQRWTGEGTGGVWQWDLSTRSAPNRGSRGEMKVEEEEFERRYQCKRQREEAEGGGGVRGWVEDATARAVSERTQEEEAVRRQHQRQHWRRSQVQ